MMRSLFFVLFLSFAVSGSFAQNETDAYLKINHYPFTLEKGFDENTSAILVQKLRNYKVILEAEGGSHFLKMYLDLEPMWIRFLHDKLQLTHFFFEGGSATSTLFNYYMNTGTIAPGWHKYEYLNILESYNKSLPAGNKLTSIGIDFENYTAYLPALKMLTPSGKKPSADIESAISVISNATDTIRSCDYITAINKPIKRSLLQYPTSFKEYFGGNYPAFEKIILNRGSCKDAFKNRNGHLADTFESFDKDLKQDIYFGSLGEAHTILDNKNTFAYLTDHKEAFKGKVCVINVYCYNCTTEKEIPSNWPLADVEKDILKILLPFCNSDLTLFDLSNVPNGRLTRLKDHGQFLIIAKNQK